MKSLFDYRDVFWYRSCCDEPSYWPSACSRNAAGSTRSYRGRPQKQPNRVPDRSTNPENLSQDADMSYLSFFTGIGYGWGTIVPIDANKLDTVVKENGFRQNNREAD